MENILKSASVKIANVLKLFRDPALNFFVEFLREKIMIREKLPFLIMSLDVKPSGKLVMLPVI